MTIQEGKQKQLSDTKKSRAVFVPCGISSFFEICDRNTDGSPIQEILRIGARGGGFIISRGSRTIARESIDGKDTVLINGRVAHEAKTSQRVIELMRAEFNFGPVTVEHEIEPFIGAGFGTSGSGAVGAAIAISDLLGLKMSLAQVSAFAHSSEILSVTGLGTVISLVSGAGAAGIVTEPGSFSVGRVDSFVFPDEEYLLFCAHFGPVEKATVLKDEKTREKVNEFGRETLREIMANPTAETLLRQSRRFAEKSGIGSPDLLRLADGALNEGALGATQNMIGNAVHCLVPKAREREFMKWFLRVVPPRGSIFQTSLYRGGPHFLEKS